MFGQHTLGNANVQYRSLRTGHAVNVRANSRRAKVSVGIDVLREDPTLALCLKLVPDDAWQALAVVLDHPPPAVGVAALRCLRSAARRQKCDAADVKFAGLQDRCVMVVRSSITQDLGCTQSDAREWGCPRRDLSSARLNDDGSLQ